VTASLASFAAAAVVAALLPPSTISVSERAGTPTIACALYDACSIFLASGEHLDPRTPYIAGDTARFKFRSGTAAGLDFIAFKPVTDDAETVLQIDTDRAVHFVRLTTLSRVVHTVYQLAGAEAPKASAAIPASVAPTPLPTVDPSIVYTVAGRAAFLPLQVWSDGQNVYLVLPARALEPTVLGLDRTGRTYPLQSIVGTVPGVLEIVGTPASFELVGGVNRGDEVVILSRKPA
jgi:type IV secretory pathway VirB9-like protein